MNAPKHTDRKRWLYSLAIPHGATPLIAAVAFATTSNPLWLALPAGWLFFLLPVLDGIVGTETRSIDAATRRAWAKRSYYSAVIYLAGLAYVASFIATIVTLTVTTELPLVFGIIYFVGAAISNAQILTLAHELGHRPGRLDRVLTTFFTGLVGYAHITSHHNGGHHVQVATPADPTSARFNETLFAFIVRETIGGIRGALRREAERIQRAGKSRWHPSNSLLQGYAVTIIAAV
ncbi:MAG: fatty acid desaturase, partial [Myxococcota bacterium]